MAVVNCITSMRRVQMVVREDWSREVNGGVHYIMNATLLQNGAPVWTCSHPLRPSSFLPMQEYHHLFRRFLEQTRSLL